MIPAEMINDHILNLANKKIVMYFLADLSDRKIDNWSQWVQRNQHHWVGWPAVFIHDQELLDFNNYKDAIVKESKIFNEYKRGIFLENLNLRWLTWQNVYDKAIITHSEVNSEEVEKYKNNGFEPVYFWSHAIIARDWFRYAEHDPVLKNTKFEQLPWNDFLIYSRGWQGSREYRLCMADMMIKYDMIECSKYSILHEENDQGIENYSIKDPRYQGLDLAKIKKSIPMCQASSDSSANYDARDFLDSAISVVLETNFSENRIHLTEKILRPIALGHPFMLASAPGSLEYLRSYGFKTYHDNGINESYDTEKDPKKRLEKICQEMRRIRDLPTKEKMELYKNLRLLAEENQKYFYSKEFEQKIFSELDNNFLLALDSVKAGSRGKTVLENSRKRRRTVGTNYYFKETLRSKRSFLMCLIRAHRNRMRRTI